MLPGLIDVHNHLVWHFNAKDRLHTENDGESAGRAALAAAANAYVTLAAGFTTGGGIAAVRPGPLSAGL